MAAVEKSPLAALEAMVVEQRAGGVKVVVG